MHAGLPQVLLFVCICLALVGSSRSQQSISQPPASLPVQSYSDDPAVTNSAASAALCSLHAILGTESAGHGIGPLTIQPDCISMTYQRTSTAASNTAPINGQTLPSSRIATIFGSGISGGTSSTATTALPTTAPSISSSGSSSATHSSSVALSSSSTTAPPQSNAGQIDNKPPKAVNWIANQNIGIVLFTAFALLVGVTFFLDELLGMLV